MRMAAAMAVLYSHSYALYGLQEPLVASLGETWGSLAVGIFFVVSGFLICQSWDRDPHVFRFAVRRALRIIPGLVVAVFFTTFVAGTVSTSMPLVEYVSDRETWAFFFNNASLIAGIDVLPGGFADTPHKGANGSLWTLRYEVLMYAALVLLALTGRLRACCVAAFAACSAGWIGMDYLEAKQYKLPLPLLWKLHVHFDVYRMAKLGALFFAGSCFNLCRHRIPASPVIALLFLAMLMWVPAEWAALALLMVVPYATLTLARSAPSVLCDMHGWDLSYGIYVYAFPVQQLVSQFCLAHDLGWFAALWMGMAVTLLLAAASWVYVEKPALALRRRFARPVLQAQGA